MTLHDSNFDVEPDLLEAIHRGLDTVDAGGTITFDEYVAQIHEERRLRDYPAPLRSRLEPEAVDAVMEALSQPEENDLPHEAFIAKRAEWRRKRDTATLQDADTE